jgi:hypothetical protein
VAVRRQPHSVHTSTEALHKAEARISAIQTRLYLRSFYLQFGLISFTLQRISRLYTVEEIIREFDRRWPSWGNEII